MDPLLWPGLKVISRVPSSPGAILYVSTLVPVHPQFVSTFVIIKTEVPSFLNFTIF